MFFSILLGKLCIGRSKKTKQLIDRKKVQTGQTSENSRCFCIGQKIVFSENGWQKSYTQ